MWVVQSGYPSKVLHPRQLVRQHHPDAQRRHGLRPRVLRLRARPEQLPGRHDALGRRRDGLLRRRHHPHHDLQRQPRADRPDGAEDPGHA
jgi:hypothetical protein